MRIKPIHPTPWDVRLVDFTTESNIEYFLKYTTPTIIIDQAEKNQGCCENVVCDASSCKGASKEDTSYKGFYLKNLWSSLAEWSGCGLGVPILLDNGIDVTVQYYAPTLSAMQVYTKKPVGRDSDQDLLSSKYVPKRNVPTASEGRSNGDLRRPVDVFGHLYFEFNELVTPYNRVPLTEKINELAKEHPGLVDLHSSALSPYSWISIAWYPIYQIPAMKNSDDLSACFLTYHSLHQGEYVITGAPSKAPQGNKKIEERERKGKRLMIPARREIIEKVLLAPFALATYRLTQKLWKRPDTSDDEVITAKENAAFSWLSSVKFEHSDFTFFISRKYRC
ncbi:hypothetical protein ACFE04_019325 [Oxalis oulophora]